MSSVKHNACRAYIVLASAIVQSSVNIYADTNACRSKKTLSCELKYTLTFDIIVMARRLSFDMEKYGHWSA